MSERDANVSYFIHGRGRGHASRATVVYRALRARGFNVHVYAGGDAESQLSDADIPYTVRAPLLPSPTALVDLVKRTYADVAAFKRHRPGLVVSDGDHAAVLAARRCGVTSLAIGHDLVFGTAFDLPKLPKAALLSQRINSLPTAAATHRIAVHFLPAHSRDPRLHIARPDVAPLAHAPNDGSILCYFRDNNGERIATTLRDRGLQVTWYTSQPVVVPGVNVLPPSVSGFQNALQRAKAVVTSAGSNVLADCVAQRKPVLALYRRYDTEQHLNALLIEQTQVGVAATFDDFSAPLDRFTHRLDSGVFATVDTHTLMSPLSTTVDRVLATLPAPAQRSANIL